MIYLTLIGSLIVIHAMLRRLTSRRCIIIIIITGPWVQLQYMSVTSDLRLSGITAYAVVTSKLTLFNIGLSIA